MLRRLISCMIYLLDETCLFKTEQLSKVCLKRLFCGPIAQFVSLQCTLTVNGAVSNCRSLGAGDANVGCHLILTAGCLTFTLKAVIHEPRGTVVTTVDGLAVKSQDGPPRPLVCHGL